MVGDAHPADQESIRERLMRQHDQLHGCGPSQPEISGGVLERNRVVGSTNAEPRSPDLSQQCVVCKSNDVHGRRLLLRAIVNSGIGDEVDRPFLD